MTPTATDIFFEPGTLARRERPRLPVRYIAPILLAGALGTGATVLQGPDAFAALQHQQVVSGTSSGSPLGLLALASRSDYGAIVRQLQQRSGLTWNELARAVGVSRRAVHHWAAGQRLSERHAQRVEELAGMISRVGAATPDATRAALVSPGLDGRSLLSRFEEESQPDRRVPLSTLTVGEFFEDGDLTPALPVPTSNRRSAVPPRRIPPRAGRTGGQ